MSGMLTGTEIMWRRRRLGLSRPELGVCLMIVSQGVLKRPVGESTVSKWEHGAGGEYLYVSSSTIALWFDRLDALASKVDEIAYCDCLKVSAGPDGVTRLTAFRNDEAFHAAHPSLAPMPCSLWNHGVVEALLRLRRERPDAAYSMEGLK